MTISTTNANNSYTANGVQTVFNYTYQLLTNSDGTVITSTTQVYVAGVLQAASAYTDTPNSNQQVSPGGAITMNAAPASPSIVNLVRNTPLTQTLVFPLEAKISTPALETAFDKNVLLVQENNYNLGLKPSLPVAVIGTILGWNALSALDNIGPGTAGYPLVGNGAGVPASFQPLTAATGGNVVGPAVVVDGHVVLFDGTTGKLIKDGGATIPAAPQWTNIAKSAAFNATGGTGSFYNVDCTAAVTASLPASVGGGIVIKMKRTAGSAALTVNVSGGGNIDNAGVVDTSVVNNTGGVMDFTDLTGGWAVT